MRVRYIGKEKMNYLTPDNDIDLTPGKVYEASDENIHDYRVVDDSGEDYLYPKSFFDIVEE